MTPELAICERLAATSAVTAIVPSARIYEFVLPQSPTLSLVLVQLIADPRNYHLRGPSKLNRSRIQVDAYVPERAVSANDDPGENLNALADAIDGSLNGKAFTVGTPVSMRVTGVFQQDRRKLREPNELRYLRVMLDYVVWSQTVS